MNHRSEAIGVPQKEDRPQLMAQAPVVLVSGDFVRTGGMDRANFALGAYLLARGREVHFVSHRVDEALRSQPRAAFHRVAKPLDSYLLGEPLLRRAGARWARRLARRGARVVVNGGNCDWGDVNWVHYVHAAWSPEPAVGVLRRAKRAWSHRGALAAERASLRKARVVIANSERTRADLVERLEIPAERVHTVYLGVDAERFRPPTEAERAEARDRMGWHDERPAFAFVGALGDRRKGLDTLLAAWRRLCAEGSWDARLVVVGAGAALGGWKEAAGDLGGSVEFLGFRRDVPDVLRACDALVSPVRYEPYGLNVHEAICCGLAAFVSRSAGVAERYPEVLVDLLIPDPDDAVDLAQRLRLWRDDPARFSAAVATLSEQLRSYTWDDMSARFVEVARL
jgi:glycosyltransferase involved in cell wall biosynthesis